MVIEGDESETDRSPLVRATATGRTEADCEVGQHVRELPADSHTWASDFSDLLLLSRLCRLLLCGRRGLDHGLLVGEYGTNLGRETCHDRTPVALSNDQPFVCEP